MRWWGNRVKGDVHGSVVQAHTIENLHVHPEHVADSYYLELVKDFTPAELVDREDELAALAAFCTSPGTEGRYVWWRAEAWAGKTALMGWFVLHPPPTVRVVSFFITARSADQNSRSHFLDNLLVQLSALMGRPLPPPSPVPRMQQVRGLLVEAARWCRERSEHLVLVVDGLDEDHGVDGTAHAHSIAACLPTVPPEGMRVIVTGRPSPPLPGDVPEVHPLRNPAVIRLLPPSPKARALGHDAERELKRVLEGGGADLDLVGLVVAARAGLTTADLAHLITDTCESEVADRLTTLTGRSFTTRSGPFPGRSPEVHVLAHEELQRIAIRVLGRRLAGYRERLHRWYDEYRARHWPVDTPEYLLFGYLTMVEETGDRDRLVKLATDAQRHQRLLELTGGDGAALAGVAAAQRRVLDENVPDLVVLTRLAVHRGHLERRNTALPTWLAAGWAYIGEFDRAESLLDSLSDLQARVNALTATAAAMLKRGDARRVEDLLERAEALAAPMNQFISGRPVGAVARARAAAGQYDLARRIARLVTGDPGPIWAWASLSLAAVNRGDHAVAAELLDETEAMRHSSQETSQPEVTATMAVVAMKLGDRTRAAALVDEAEAELSAAHRFLRGPAMPWVAHSAALLGDHDRALRITTSIGDPDAAEAAADDLLDTIARADVEKARAVARTAPNATTRCVRLAAVAAAVASTGGSGWVPDLIAEAETAASTITDPTARANAAVWTAVAWAEHGDLARASAIVDRHADRIQDAEGLLSVATAAMRVGDEGTARNLLALATDVARADPDPAGERLSVTWIQTMADFRDFDRAERAARSLRDQAARSAAWAAIAEAAVVADDLDRAENAIGRVEQAAAQRRPREEFVRTATARGEHDRAESVALGIANPLHRVHVLLIVVRSTGRSDLFDQVREVVETLPDPKDRFDGSMSLLRTAVGLADRARAASLLDVVHHLVETSGDVDIRRPRIPELTDLERSLESAGLDPASFDTNDMRRRRRRLSGSIFKAQMPTRLRTLVELAKCLDRMSVLDGFDIDDDVLSTPSAIDPFAPVGTVHRGDLARELASQDWRHHVEELVALRPDAYSAIVEELDALAGARPGGVTGTS